MESDEPRQKRDDLMAGDFRKANHLVESELLILQGIDELTDSICISHHSALRLLCFTPDGQMNGRSYYVFISNADIGTLATFIIYGADGAFILWRNCCNNDGAPLNMISIKLDAGLRTAITISSLVHHIDFLLIANA